VGEPRPIRTSASFVLFALWAASSLACAKGSEISTTEIVILQALPPDADAGADAAAAPSEPTADQATPGAEL
jgi:hypothetical protein